MRNQVQIELILNSVILAHENEASNSASVEQIAVINYVLER